jgi:hypothetical protein
VLEPLQGACHARRRSTHRVRRMHHGRLGELSTTVVGDFFPQLGSTSPLARPLCPRCHGTGGCVRLAARLYRSNMVPRSICTLS